MRAGVRAESTSAPITTDHGNPTVPRSPPLALPFKLIPRFPLPPAQNPEKNVNDIMLRFEGRDEELGETLRLMRD